MADDALRMGVQGISDIICGGASPNDVCVDFADVKSVMSEAGGALMGIGEAKGEGAVIEAAKKAIQSRLLEQSIDGAKGVVINIVGSEVAIQDVNEATSIVSGAADPDCNTIWGIRIDESMGDAVRVTIIATGFPRSSVLPFEAPKTPAFKKPLANSNAANSDNGAKQTEQKPTLPFGDVPPWMMR